jgi:hypothetical protein
MGALLPSLNLLFLPVAILLSALFMINLLLFY